MMTMTMTMMTFDDDDDDDDDDDVDDGALHNSRHDKSVLTSMYPTRRINEHLSMKLRFIS